VRPGWIESPRRGPLAFEPDHRPDKDQVDTCDDRPVASRPAVFLDRDGVLNELARDPVSGEPESPLGVGDVHLIAGAAAAARELAQAGFVLVCVSNQPAAAKGKITVERLQAVHERVVDLLARQQMQLDASRLCLHHPDGVLPALSGRCRCRKPQPGMLLDAAAALDLDLGASWMVGDTDADVAAGHSAGCRTILLEYLGSAHKRSRGAHSELHATDLASAVAPLLRERSR
jgi:D-glycero-D-manno-heptose 1,7-bisphosphate phosphatase